MRKSLTSCNKRSMQFVIEIICFITLFSRSVDGYSFGQDYYRTLINSYLSDGEVDNALRVTKEGLKEHPNDPELRRILNVIEEGRKRQAAEEEGKERQLREEEQKARAIRENAEEKALLMNAYCGCLATKRIALKRIANENRVGEISGFVDKIALREAGVAISSAEKAVSFMSRHAKRVGIELKECKEEGDEVDELLACHRYISKYEREISKE